MHMYCHVSHDQSGSVDWTPWIVVGVGVMGRGDVAEPLPGGEVASPFPPPSLLSDLGCWTHDPVFVLCFCTLPIESLNVVATE